MRIEEIEPKLTAKEFIRPMYLAARRCHCSDERFFSESALSLKKTYHEMVHLVKHCYKQKHLGVLEHRTITLNIEGISRVTSHQLVRYRHASFCQQSQRHVPQINDCAVPPTIERNNAAEKIYEKIMCDAYEAYQNLYELGIPLEDARYCLPAGYTTSLVMTMNVAEMLHIIEQRTDKTAQWEIRELANQLKRFLGVLMPAFLEGEA